MISFPSTTVVGRLLPKEAFYKRLPLKSGLKEKFVADIKRITLSNKLTASTLNLKTGGDITEILLLTIDLKKQHYDGRVMESIARQNSHKLIFLLQFEMKARLAVYHAKLYTTKWKSFDEVTLATNGTTLDMVWQGFLEQIALLDGLTHPRPNENFDALLRRQEAILQLQKQLAELEKKAMAERQQRKKWELAEEIQKLKTELGEIL